MAVRSEFRRQGIGRAMLHAVDAHAAGIYGVSQVCLHVEECNTSALAIYSSASFTKAAVDDKGAGYLDRLARPGVLSLLVGQAAVHLTRPHPTSPAYTRPAAICLHEIIRPRIADTAQTAARQ
jgi:hypothetical protein